MKRSEIRAQLINSAADGWFSTPGEKFELRDDIKRHGCFALEKAKFGIEEAIRSAENEQQFNLWKDYWFSLTNIGRKRLALAVSKEVERRAFE